jgi:hypothetical protein
MDVAFITANMRSRYILDWSLALSSTAAATAAADAPLETIRTMPPPARGLVRDRV